MRSLTTLTTLTALASTAYGFVYTVGVGKDQTTGQPGVGFDPSRVASGLTLRVVTAQLDSTVVTDLTIENEVQFRFLQGNHRVVQSDFDSPCASNGGFDSGEKQVASGTAEENGPVETFNIANNSGVYYFSDIGNGGNECYLGAVFCLNTNEADDATACHTFQANALALGAQNGVTANSTTSTAASIPSTASATSTTSSGASSATSGASTTTSGGSSTRSQSASGTTAAPSQSGGTSGASALGVAFSSKAGVLTAGVVGLVAAFTF
ncbi:hypothetical protein JCM3766R1_003916 [Sporobolomyces carnicolor]